MKTAREEILSAFTFERDVQGEPVVFTATDLARMLGLSLASLSSTLKKMVTTGALLRAPKFGVRGGYGYYVPYRPIRNANG